MKHPIAVFLLYLCCCTGYTQSLKVEEVPQVVKTSFANMLPDAKDVEWEKEGELYEGEFEINNVENSLLFKVDGTYVMKEEEIPVAQLPASVIDYAAKNLAGKKIKEAAKMTFANGTIQFEAEVENDDYIFDSNGNFVEMEVEDDDGEEDD